ncbi:helix-turn-helix domain-containing protein [Streptomyces sp. NBC_00328]|uniref:helix-turn-helix domain-containing protein n=1 Tax=Streptomyces sp. NBC_00328 TaxID=2903646 RepID=UPI002E2C4309|nr:helix-turn-helix transcriptional regulator [Streptomyces sp. NBC_00328]
MAGDEFAGLLRELKARSGLSYGALAKRLHVSTSTLHRYVNGDAVPTDYAPVERLARMCRATPEELIELHRSWVLADALRRQKTPGAGSPPGAVTVAVAEGEGDGTETAGGSAEADSAPGGGAAGSPTEAGNLPSSAPEPVPKPGPVTRSRRALLLAGAVAVVVTAIVSTTLALNFGSGGGDGDSKGEAVPLGIPPTTGPRGTGTTPDAHHGSASPSASHSGRPKVSSSTIGGAVDENGVVESGAAGKGGAAEDGAGAPAVVADAYKWDSPCSQHYLVNRDAPQVPPPPPNESDARGWVTALGGVASGEQMLALTVQGTGRATVVVEALHVRVVRKDVPLAWNDYAMGVGCGGGVETKSFTVDLDAGQPVTALKGGQRDFPYKVSESDPEVFYVFADARAHDVSWYLELDWTSGTKSGTVRVDDHGKPFRTSGNTGRPAYNHPLGGSEWVSAPSE